MKRKVAVIPALLLSVLSLAQDIHFSQYTEHNPLLNPALVGANNNLRISSGYRSQWSAIGAPFTTSGVSLEVRSPARRRRIGRFGLSRNKIPGRFAIGASVYKDVLGDQTFSRTLANLTLATFIKTSDKSFLSFGLQGSFIQSHFSSENFLFPDQYGGSGYDVNILSADNYTKSNYANYADASAGLAWSFGENVKGFTDHRETKIKLGMSAYHLLQPKVKYLKTTGIPQEIKYVMHAEVLFSLNSSKYSLSPSILYQVQGVHSELIGGAILRYYHRHDTHMTGYLKRTTIGFGAYYRTNDAVVANLLLEVQGMYAIGFTYDFITSSLKTASYKGAMELAFRFNPAGAFVRQK